MSKQTPRWKHTVAVWLGMLPLNLTVSLLISQLSWWEHVPVPLRSVLIVSTMVPLMTFAIMPTVTRILRAWLHRNPEALRNERVLCEALDARARASAATPGH